ncbi:MAG: DUF1844 domain-containing protein [Verrucomicrobiae bacterium]|nr:DUF1844 domain-containing protein [Verrucomicrobiae bacterium]
MSNAPHPKPEADAQRRESSHFARLIDLLAQNAAMLLGGMADRQGRQMPPDLRAAELFIEMLAVLQKRTKGNLTKEEQRMLSGTLYQLQSAFAEVASKSGEFEKARKASEAAEAADDGGIGEDLGEDFDAAEGAPSPPPPAEAGRPGSPAPGGARPQGIQPSAIEPRESKVKFTKKYG